MTPRQRSVLAHMVVDPDAWYAHAVNEFGQQQADEFLRQKVARWEPDFDRESKRQAYKTRAEREADAAQREQR